MGINYCILMTMKHFIDDLTKKELIELQIVNDQITLPSAMTCNQLISSKSNKKLIYANFNQLE